MLTQELLPPSAQKPLVQAVRQAIASVVCGKQAPTDTELQAIREQYPELQKPSGAFVTIYVADELRGCLGEIDAQRPMLETVLACARRVPVADYRFEAVREDELLQMEFKISLLSPLEPLARPDEIEVGRDGLYVRYEGHGGLLLPDVPLEYGWDRATFVRHLWRKAHIDPNVPWEATLVWRFTTQIIDSESFRQTN
jgi:AmmeMemoRadiSam system protein A